MKTKHPNGPELYDSKPGKGKGTHRVRLWESGKNIATNGEGHMNHSQCESWPDRVLYAILVWKVGKYGAKMIKAKIAQLLLK